MADRSQVQTALGHERWSDLYPDVWTRGRLPPSRTLAPIATRFHPFLVRMADPDRLRGLPIFLIHAVLRAAGAKGTHAEVDTLSHSHPGEMNGPILNWMGIQLLVHRFSVDAPANTGEGRCLQGFKASILMIAPFNRSLLVTMTSWTPDGVSAISRASS